jgi:energy-coupling factor transport system permease protein
MSAGSMTKFIFAISAAFAVAVSNNAGFLLIVFMAVLTAFVAWGGGPRDILRVARVAIWFFLLVFVLHLFAGSGRVLFKIWFLNARADGLQSGLFYGLKLLVFVYSAYLIFFKVDPAGLIKPLERAARYLGPAGRLLSSFLITFSLALRFLPELSRQAKTTVIAFRSRGYEIGGSIKNRITVGNLLMISIFVNTFKRAESVSIALNVRGYPLRYRQAVFPPPKISLSGIFIFIVSISMLYAGWMSR